MWNRIYSRHPLFFLPQPFSLQQCWWLKVGQLPFIVHTHTHLCVWGECSGQCPDMLDSWEICQPSGWAFQTMPHNVLDSPEKQPGAWKLPAHHLNSLIWALSGFPSPSLSLSPALCLCYCSLPPNFIPLLIYHPSSHFSLINALYDKPLPPPIYFTHSLSSSTRLILFFNTLSQKVFVTQPSACVPLFFFLGLHLVNSLMAITRSREGHLYVHTWTLT